MKTCKWEKEIRGHVISTLKDSQYLPLFPREPCVVIAPHSFLEDHLKWWMALHAAVYFQIHFILEEHASFSSSSPPPPPPPLPPIWWYWGLIPSLCSYCSNTEPPEVDPGRHCHFSFWGRVPLPRTSLALERSSWGKGVWEWWTDEVNHGYKLKALGSAWASSPATCVDSSALTDQSRVIYLHIIQSLY